MIGKRFGKLVVLEKSSRKQHFACRCDCGNISVIFRGNLTRGNSTSCGCTRKTADGLSGTNRAEYYCWSGMLKRCHNKNDKSYKDYGGRGISVCEEWRNSFEQFLVDMGKRPSSLHSIDRIQNDYGYNPSNCRWTTKDIQANNTRRNHYITYKNEILTIAQASDKYNVPRATLLNRINLLNWSVDDAIEKPHFAGLYPYNGKMLRLPEVSKLSGIKYATLYSRIKIQELDPSDAFKV